MDLEDYLVAKFAQVIQSWPPDLVRDIYALSLYRDDNNYPYRPAVYLAYNTHSHFRQQEQTHPSGEAKWNLALWPHNGWVGIEDEGQHGRVRDEEGTQAVDAWLSSVAGKEQAADSADVIPQFAALCVRVARRLHDAGIIRETFGRDVPIIMHDDEWDDAMMRNTEAANPPGVVRAFLEAEVF